MEASAQFDYAGWELFDSCAVTGIVRYRKAIGDGMWLQRTEYPHTEALFNINHEELMQNQGTSWGDGKVVGRIPMNVLFNDKLGLSDAVADGDDAYVNKWLYHGDNAKFRTRGGRL